MKRAMLQEESEVPSLSENEYFVERILNKKEVAGIEYYLIKWEGFPEWQSTWEPKGNLSRSQELLLEYESCHAPAPTPTSGPGPGPSPSPCQWDQDRRHPATKSAQHQGKITAKAKSKAKAKAKSQSKLKSMSKSKSKSNSNSKRRGQKQKQKQKENNSENTNNNKNVNTNLNPNKNKNKSKSKNKRHSEKMPITKQRIQPDRQAAGRPNYAELDSDRSARYERRQEAKRAKAKGESKALCPAIEPEGPNKASRDCLPEPQRILGCRMSNEGGGLEYVLEWVITGRKEPLTAVCGSEELADYWPHLLISYLEKHIPLRKKCSNNNNN